MTRLKQTVGVLRYPRTTVCKLCSSLDEWIDGVMKKSFPRWLYFVADKAEVIAAWSIVWGLVKVLYGDVTFVD